MWSSTVPHPNHSRVEQPGPKTLHGSVLAPSTSFNCIGAGIQKDSSLASRWSDSGDGFITEYSVTLRKDWGNNATNDSFVTGATLRVFGQDGPFAPTLEIAEMRSYQEWSRHVVGARKDHLQRKQV